MKVVFVDTGFWIAVTNQKDQWHDSAKAAFKNIGKARLVTTDEVLTEFVTGLGVGGEHLRSLAIQMVKKIKTNPNINVVPQSRDSHTAGLKLFEERPDKDYSLTDCISMNTMRTEGIVEVLTNDHHFAQEGFITLF